MKKRQKVIRGLICILFFYTALCYSEFMPFQPLPLYAPVTESNPQSDKKIVLGKHLFFDMRLSRNRNKSCNSCHDLKTGGDDNGVMTRKRTNSTHKSRSAPTLWNVAFQTVYFWDGRENSLESLVKNHIFAETFMGNPDAREIKNRLEKNPEFLEQINSVFSQETYLFEEKLSWAIASFIRTLITPNSRFDQFISGDKTQLTQIEQQGYEEFINLGCASCHFWVNFSGPVPGLAYGMGEGFYELFPNYLGTEYEVQYQLIEDMGRYHVTGNKGDKYLWRVPTLRNIELTAPYFHNGSVDTLEEAVRVMAKTQLNKQPGKKQVDAIVSFLRALTGEFPQAVKEEGAIESKAHSD